MSFINENPNNTIKEISLPNGESYTFNAEYLDGKAFSDIVELINKAADMGFNLHVCTKAEDTPYGVILDSELEPVTGTLVAEDAEKKTFYLVKSDKTKNDYDEYVVVDSFKTPKWEKIGSTEIDIDSLKKVFTRSENGMVPAPGAAQSLPRTLWDNGYWYYNSMYIVYIDTNIPSDEFQKFAMEQQITLEKLQPYISLGVMLVDTQSISGNLMYLKESCIGIKINEDTRFNMGDGSTELTSVSFLLHIIMDAQSNRKEWVFATLDANGWTYTPIFQEVKNDVYVNYDTPSYNIIKNAIDNKQMVYVRYGHQQPLSIDWAEYPYSETIQTGQPAGKPKFRFSNGINYFDVTLEEEDGNEITSWTPLTSCADQTIIEDSTNAVAGGAVYAALQDTSKKPLKVTIIESEGSYTADISSADIYAAWLEGRYVYAQFESNLLTLGTEPSATACTFQMSATRGIIYTQFTVRGNYVLKGHRYIISSNGLADYNTIYSTLLLDYTINSDKQAVNKEYVDAQIATRQPNLTFDNMPTPESTNPVTSNGIYAALGVKVNRVIGKDLSSNDYTDADKEKLASIEQATDDTLGLVKLNPNEGVDLNADGQLVVDGRLGQFPDGGLYYPQTAEPTNVGANSLLITDGAKGLSVAPRTLSIMAGVNLTIRAAEAGSTEYHAVNNENNRFICAAVNVDGARLAIDMNDAATNGTAAILSIKYADGRDCIPYFGDVESDNDIIITVDKTVNPNAATTKLRLYGTAVTNDVISLGQGVTGHSKGISIGQSCRTAKQQTVALGNQVYVAETNSFGFGKFIYIPKQFCFATGQGHDFTYASNGTSAFGQWGVIDGGTMMAVGNGTNSSNRSNAFEIKNNGDAVIGGGVILTSPNGTKYKLTVADDGTLTTTAV